MERLEDIFGGNEIKKRSFKKLGHCRWLILGRILDGVCPFFEVFKRHLQRC
jgi:hypothetical protein